MPHIIGIPPEILKSRHRLSAEQINLLAGGRVIEESYEEKAGTLVKVAEFIKVTDLLRAGGIDFIPLKGPLLSFRLYGDATTRRYGDIDILVDPASMEFSINSFTTDAGLSITSPAAIRLIVSSESK